MLLFTGYYFQILDVARAFRVFPVRLEPRAARGRPETEFALVLQEEHLHRVLPDLLQPADLEVGQGMANKRLAERV